jgi:hypothetical protein
LVQLKYRKGRWESSLFDELLEVLWLELLEELEHLQQFFLLI